MMEIPIADITNLSYIAINAITETLCIAQHTNQTVQLLNSIQNLEHPAKKNGKGLGRDYGSGL